MRASIKRLGSTAVAFSGGVDSTLLLREALDVLGRDNVLAVIAQSEFVPRSETLAARRLAGQLGAHMLVADARPLDSPDIASNGPDKCYHCKSLMLDVMWPLVRARGLSHLIEGSNADDNNDFRPGSRALQEKGVQSPMREAGLTKEEIRLLARCLGLANHDKPADACLATRIPYGTAITAGLLQKVEMSEAAVRGITGLRGVRVRCHGAVARIEVAPPDLGTVMDKKDEIADALKRQGFIYVALDLDGYRTGSMNES